MALLYVTCRSVHGIPAALLVQLDSHSEDVAMSPFGFLDQLLDTVLLHFGNVLLEVHTLLMRLITLHHLIGTHSHLHWRAARLRLIPCRMCFHGQNRSL